MRQSEHQMVLDLYIFKDFIITDNIRHQCLGLLSTTEQKEFDAQVIIYEAQWTQFLKQQGHII